MTFQDDVTLARNTAAALLKAMDNTHAQEVLDRDDNLILFALLFKFIGEADRYYIDQDRRSS